MNLNLVVNPSNFRPFDYSLAWRAIDEYNKGYEKSQAVYDKISQTLGDLASAVEGSTKAKEMYDMYQDRFNAAANQFYNNGMNYNTARDLGELRKLYGTQIRQLERANEARVKAAELIRAQNKDNDYLHENIGDLDLWMDDPNRTIRGYSGNRLMTETSAMMGSIAKSMRQLKSEGRLDDYNKIWIESGGFTPERIDKAISELQTGGINAVSDPVIQGVLRNVAASSGTDDWADPVTIQRRNEFMARGLYGGIGETKIGHYTDLEAQKDLEYKFRIKEIEDSLKLKQQQNLNSSLGIYGRSYLEETESNGKTKYQNIQTTMQSLLDTKGNIKSAYYSDKMKRAGISPLMVYEEYQKYVMTHRRIPEQGDESYLASLYKASLSGDASMPDYSGALKYVQDTYGVKDILNYKQYETMKQLGYTDKDFAISSHSKKDPVSIGQDYIERLANLAKRNTVSFASGKKITQLLAERIGQGLTHYKSKNALKELDDKSEEVDDAEWNAVTSDDIIEVGIDIGKEKLIFVTNNGNKYAVDPNIISTDYQTAWNKLLREGIKDSSGKVIIPSKREIEDSNWSSRQKSDALYSLQEAILTDLMKHVGRGNFQTLSETTSKED